MSLPNISRSCLRRTLLPTNAGSFKPIWRPTRFDGILKIQTRNNHNGRRPNHQPQPVQPPKEPPAIENHFSGENSKSSYLSQHAQHEKESYEKARQIQNAINPWSRLLRQGIFAITFSTGAYTLFTYLEAKDELKREEAARAFPKVQWPSLRRQEAPSPMQILTGAFNELNSIEKLSYGIIATNGAVALGSVVAPGLWQNLAHIPALPRSWTLFTSTFAHFGAMHLLFNMWACYIFLPSVGRSPLFEGSAYHTLAFFLSAGVISGYGQHVASIAPAFSFNKVWNCVREHRLPSAFHRSAGASGALYAVFAAFCMEYPNAQVGLLFIPFGIAASTMLPLAMAFDAYGMVFGIPRLSFGHAAHLSGALIGAGYSYYDGKEKIWKPLVRFFYRRLREQKKHA